MKIIVTVLGKDKVGIIAMVSKILTEHTINILNLDQSILDGYFHMILIADMTGANIALHDLQEKLKASGESMGLEIRVQHEGIFQSMHRI